MTLKKNDRRLSFYEIHPKTCLPDDFWGQVKRTVNGKPVSDDQIEIIVQEVSKGLNLQKDDILLDLCCGNGALTTLLFSQCCGGLGVDFSEVLIDVAKKNFLYPGHEYILSDVVEYTRAPTQSKRFTKILCYGSFAYLDAANAEALLRNCFDFFENCSVFYIGNCPDKDCLSEFFRKEDYVQGIEDDPDSAIGIWRTKDEFAAIAQSAGWSVEFKSMPENFYASQYRYDVILKRKR